MLWTGATWFWRTTFWSFSSFTGFFNCKEVVRTCGFLWLNFNVKFSVVNCPLLYQNLVAWSCILGCESILCASIKFLCYFLMILLLFVEVPPWKPSNWMPVVLFVIYVKSHYLEFSLGIWQRILLSYRERSVPSRGKLNGSHLLAVCYNSRL